MPRPLARAPRPHANHVRRMPCGTCAPVWRFAVLRTHPGTEHGSAARRIRLPDIRACAACDRRSQRAHCPQIGLPAIVAYLIGGMIIGPSGWRFLRTPESIIPVSELGVVMLLFLIGLELELGQLLAMRRAIFGLGAAQLALTALAIGALAHVAGLARLARRHRRGACAGNVGDRDRAANSRGSRRAAAELRPTRLCHPPVPGHGRGAAACTVAAARAGKRKRARRLRPRRTGSGAHCGRDCAHRPGRPLSAQSVLSIVGPERIARGDDRGGAAGCAGRGADHAAGWHVDGARRFSCRRAARRIELSA